MTKYLIHQILMKTSEHCQLFKKKSVYIIQSNIQTLLCAITYVHCTGFKNKSNLYIYYLLPTESLNRLNLISDAVITTLVLFLFSKFTISASFLIIYPFAGELYPTQLRGIGIGTSAYIAGLGLVLIPFINYLVSIYKSIYQYNTYIHTLFIHYYIDYRLYRRTYYRLYRMQGKMYTT